MVAEVQQGLADADIAVDDFDLDVAEAPPEAEADPVEELRAEIAAAKQELSELRGLRGLNPKMIESVLGQIGALQGDFQRFKQGSDPIAAIDPRLSESEDVLSVLVDALVSSDFLDDSSKTGLRQVRSRMEANKSERSATKLRRDVLREVQEARGEIAQAQTQPTDLTSLQLAFASADAELRGYATAKGIDYAAIPQTVLSFTEAERGPGSRGDFKGAMDRIKASIDTMAGEVEGAGRVGNRRRAAGAGAPSSAGTGQYRTQTAVSTAHANGQLSTAQVKAMRDSGVFASLPFQ